MLIHHVHGELDDCAVWPEQALSAVGKCRAEGRAREDTRPLADQPSGALFPSSPQRLRETWCP